MILLGTTEDVTTCDCCGKSELKKTIAFDNGGITVYYGVVCASKETGKSTDEIKSGIKQIENETKVDNLFVDAKSETKKLKALAMADKMGMNMDDIFLKYGDFDHETKWEKIYTIGNKVRAIRK